MGAVLRINQLITRTFWHNYQRFLFLWLFTFVGIGDALCQKLNNLEPTIGLTWRSTAMNFFDLGPIWPDDNSRQYSYEQNVQGFGLNIGLQWHISKSLVLEYSPAFRYDYVMHRYDDKDNQLAGVINGDTLWFNSNPIDIKNFLVDHNLNISKKFPGSAMIGVGVTIVNSGKVIVFPAIRNSQIPKFQQDRHFNIEFLTYNIFYTFPIKKVINLELKALYVPKGEFPYNRRNDYLMYSIRAYYNLSRLAKKN